MPAVSEVAPVGWPADLGPPGSNRFDDDVTAWLLDRGPGEWRAHDVLRRYPPALSALLITHLEARLTALRRHYGSVRRDMREVMPPAEIPELLTAIEADGSLTAETLRQVRLVDEALSGRRWRRRL